MFEPACKVVKGGNVFKYLDEPNVQNNNLKKTRVELGLTITELSRLASVSTKVISQTERGLTNPTEVTKSKIINGLNSAQASKGKNWKFNDIFPEEV